MYSDNDWQYLEEFCEDAKFQLQNIGLILLDLSNNKNQNPELLNQMIRFIHSLGTNSEILGLDFFSSISYRWEESFKLVRDYNLFINAKIETLGLNLLDGLLSLINLIESGDKNQEKQYSQATETICSNIEKYLKVYIKCHKSSFVPFGNLTNLIDMKSAISSDLKELDNQDKLVKIIIENKEIIVREYILEHFAINLLPPLIHNAISHGIEPSNIRLKTRKNTEGLITISVKVFTDKTIINFRDDGAGINPEIVKKKAIEKNIITLEESQYLSLKDIFNLLFKSGFSTKDTANLTSGRGFGMDIIKTELTNIGGDIFVDSQLGIGTNFQLIYPYI